MYKESIIIGIKRDIALFRSNGEYDLAEEASMLLKKLEPKPKEVKHNSLMRLGLTLTGKESSISELTTVLSKKLNRSAASVKISLYNESNKLPPEVGISNKIGKYNTQLFILREWLK